MRSIAEEFDIRNFVKTKTKGVSRSDVLDALQTANRPLSVGELRFDDAADDLGRIIKQLVKEGNLVVSHRRGYPPVYALKAQERLPPKAAPEKITSSVPEWPKPVKRPPVRKPQKAKPVAISDPTSVPTLKAANNNKFFKEDHFETARRFRDEYRAGRAFYLDQMSYEISAILRAAIIEERSIQQIEAALKIPCRSGKVLLRVGLGHLAEIYEGKRR